MSANLPFCADPFFNLSVTWYVLHPDLTDCWKHAMMRLIPLGWLVLALLFGLPCLLRASRPSHLEHMKLRCWPLLWAKLIVIFLFGATSTADLIYQSIVASNQLQLIDAGNSVWFSEASVILILAPVLEFASVVIGILFTICEHCRLYFMNPAFIIFWFFESLFYIAVTYTASLELNEQTSTMLPFEAALIYLHLLFALTAFILECFGPLNWLPFSKDDPLAKFSPYREDQCIISRKVYTEIPGKKSKREEKEEYVVRKPCPEGTGSYASFWTFAWFTDLIVKGFRRPLEMWDIWLLNKEETAVYNDEIFTERWFEEVRRWRLEKEQKAATAKAKAAIAHENKGETNGLENPKFDSLSNVNGNRHSNGTLSATSKGSSENVTDGSQASINTTTTDGLKSNGKNGKGAKGNGGPPAPPADGPALAKVLTQVYWMPLLFSQFSMLIYNLIHYIIPLVLWLFLLFMQVLNPNGQPVESWKGYVLAVIFFLLSLVQTFLYQNSFHLSTKASVRIRASIINVIYRKCMTLSPTALAQTSSAGEILSFLAVDLYRLHEMIGYIWLVWATPLCFILTTLILWFIMNWICFIALAICIIGLIINILTASVIRFFIVKWMIWKDKRIHFMDEVLNGIKIIKLYAWETPFSGVIYKYRDNEIRQLFMFFMLQIPMMIVFMVLPFIAASVCFIIDANIHTEDPQNGLNGVSAFVAFALINNVQIPLGYMPFVINMVASSVVAFKRFSGFLGINDVNPDNVLHIENEETKRNPIIIQNGCFSWRRDDEMTLKNINLNVKHGELIGVVGTIGAGKSSLMSAILGEMEKISGTVNVTSHKVAYVAQSAWIQNATLKNNILFGEAFDQARYDRVIAACELKRDLEILPGGDMTEIGERGLNLSGGQKQRVAVARAAYSNADIFLLDDPLSAVDVHVGKHLFEHVFGPHGILAENGATRVLVTHGIHYLPNCDRIICLADGSIREQGTFNELMAQGSHFSKLVREFQKEAEQQEKEEKENDKVEEDEDEEDSEDDLGLQNGLMTSNHSPLVSNEQLEAEGDPRKRTDTSESKQAKIALEKARSEKAKLVSSEESAMGNVSPMVYVWYMFCAGIVNVILYVITFILFEGMSIFSYIWLAVAFDNPSFNSVFINIYTDSMELEALKAQLSNLSSSQPSPGGNATAIAALNSSINALQSNVTVMMNQLISTLNYYMWWFFGFGWFQALLISFNIVAITFVVFYGARNMHSRILERLIRAPMSFFDTTPAGRIMNRFSKDLDQADFYFPLAIRTLILSVGQMIAIFVVIAYVVPIFLAVLGPILIMMGICLFFYMPAARQLRRLEAVTKSPLFSHVAETLHGRCTIKAFARTEKFFDEQARITDTNHALNFASLTTTRYLSIFIDGFSSCLVLAAACFCASGRDDGSVGTGKAGLALAFAIAMQSSSTMLMRYFNDLEVNAVAVERIKEYTEIVNEAPWNIEDTKPSKDWPETGNIKLEGYSTRYREGLDLVLRNISLDIKPMEKIGICGRTGAGKSSVTLALFRLVESVDGRIVIDGHDTSKMGLHQLRSRITILPQDPVIFSGTLRFNLDPFGEYDDSAIWRALEQVRLRDFFSGAGLDTTNAGLAGAARSKGLEFQLEEGGTNISVGQRQLLCLARALLRRTRVLVLDEATAAVDYETDSLIQATIRREFKECTVLTIAHRINTILDSDRILLLDQGRVKEFDSPQALLAQGEKSTFYQMVSQAGQLAAGLGAK